MKKYLTKSGTVEEKLPGVNATVNPSEKAQIAMAGGADTLKDVQTILGQEGKRNNLKGQGAKHLVSFQYEDMAEGGYTGPGSPAAGYMSDDSGYDYTGEGDWTLPDGPPGGSPMGGGDGPPGNWNEAKARGKEVADLYGSFITTPPSSPSPKDLGRLSAAKEARDAATMAAELEEADWAGGIKAVASPLSKSPSPESKPEYKTVDRFQKPTVTDLGLELPWLGKDRKVTPSKGYTPPEQGFNLNDLIPSRSEQLQLGLVKGAVDVGMAKTGMGALFGVGGILGSLAYYALTAPDPPATHGGQRMNETKDQFESRKAGLEKAAKAKTAYQAQPTKMDPKTPWTPPPDDPYSGGDDAPKKKKLIRSAANNVTLPISEQKDKRSLRDIMRGRGGWRFA
jgi:hypothetical protein